MTDVKTRLEVLASQWEGCAAMPEAAKLLRDAKAEIERLEPLAARAVSQTVDQLRAAFITVSNLRMMADTLLRASGGAIRTVDIVTELRGAAEAIEGLERELRVKVRYVDELLDQVDELKRARDALARLHDEDTHAGG
jgi:hypothetical protein